METQTINWKEIHEKLMEPFPADVLEFLPKGNPGASGEIMALAYIQSRDVMNRLDDVVGPGNWSFDWLPMDGDGKAIKGTLTVLGVSRADVGQSDKEEEPWKSAVSDALKRVAVHFGIGRFLYDLPQIWVKAQPYTVKGKEYYKFADKNDPYRKLTQLLGQKQQGHTQQTVPSAESTESKPRPATQKPAGNSSAVVPCEWPAGCDKAISNWKNRQGTEYTAEQMAEFSRKDCDGHAFCYNHKKAWADGERPESEPPAAAEGPTAFQIRAIHAEAGRVFGKDDAAKAPYKQWLADTYAVSSSKELSQAQCSEAIKALAEMADKKEAA